MSLPSEIPERCLWVIQALLQICFRIIRDELCFSILEPKHDRFSICFHLLMALLCVLLDHSCHSSDTSSLSIQDTSESKIGTRISLWPSTLAMLRIGRRPGVTVDAGVTAEIDSSFCRLAHSNGHGKDDATNRMSRICWELSCRVHFSFLPGLGTWKSIELGSALWIQLKRNENCAKTK